MRCGPNVRPLKRRASSQLIPPNSHPKRRRNTPGNQHLPHSKFRRLTIHRPHRPTFLRRRLRRRLLRTLPPRVLRTQAPRALRTLPRRLPLTRRPVLRRLPRPPPRRRLTSLRSLLPSRITRLMDRSRPTSQLRSRTTSRPRSRPHLSRCRSRHLPRPRRYGKSTTSRTVLPLRGLRLIRGKMALVRHG